MDWEKHLKSKNDDSKKAGFWNAKANKFLEMNSKIHGEREDGFIRRTLEFLNFLGEDGTVLDVGCGFGRNAQVLSSQAKKYVGIDVSDKMIELAKNRNMASNRSFYQVDWENTTLKEQFTLVFSSMCPAIDSQKALEKMNMLSKKFCMVHRFLEDMDPIHDVFGKDGRHRSHNNKKYVEALTVGLWEMGYEPQMIIDEGILQYEKSLDELAKAYVLNKSELEEEKGDWIFDQQTQIVKYKRKYKRALIFWSVQ